MATTAPPTTLESLEEQIIALSEQLTMHSESVNQRFDDLSIQNNQQDAEIADGFSRLKDLIENTNGAVAAILDAVDMVQDGVTANSSDLQEAKLGIDELKAIVEGEGIAEPGTPSKTEIPGIPRIDLPEKTRILGVLVGFLENGVSDGA